MAALRQGPNLRKHLCRSKLSKQSRDTQYQRNTRKNVCPLTVPPKQTIQSQVSEYSHTIKTPVNCQSQNVIYLWRCKKENCARKPENFYIGMSSRKFQTRFSEHLGYIKSEKCSEPSGEHFNHYNPYILRAREVLMIQKFDAFKFGLNQEP